MMDPELTRCIEDQDLEGTKRILQNKPQPSDDLNEALTLACVDSYPRSPDIIELLLQNGASPNTVHRGRFKPTEKSLLYHVLQYPNEEEDPYRICELFLRYGANPNAGERDGKGNAFFEACGLLREDIVKLFLQYGATPDPPLTEGHAGATALYNLFTDGDDRDAMARITMLLLSAGARPNIPCGTWQRTPLMMATEAGAEEAVAILLRAGASPNLSDTEGVTTANIACARGYTRILVLLQQHGGTVSEYQLQSARLREAVLIGDHAKAAVIGDNVLGLSDRSLDDCRLIGIAFSTVGRHDEAIGLAQSCVDQERSASTISRLITAMVKASRYDRSIEIWKRYRDCLSFDSFDPFMIANLLYAYDRLERQKEGIVELEKWFTSDGAGGDDGFMKFNAACLYSLCGDLEQALAMAAGALECGKDRESFYRDSGLEALRARPTFALLMTDSPVSAAVEHVETNHYAEILLRGTEVSIRERNRRDDLASCQATILEHGTRAEAILTYQRKLDERIGAGYRESQPYSIEYWVAGFADDFQKIKQAQKMGDLPALGAYVVEWDFGDSDCERNIWTAYFSHDRIPDPDRFFSDYVFGDNVLGENSLSGPSIDTAAQFEVLVHQLIQTEAFSAITKEAPFYFVYQEHDSGHIHTVKI